MCRIFSRYCIKFSIEKDTEMNSKAYEQEIQQSFIQADFVIKAMERSSA